LAGRVYIDVRGDIELGDDEKFDAVLKDIPDPSRAVVRLSSDGGNFLAGLQMAATIHDEKITTYVPGGNYCLSICATMWISGEHRVVDEESKIGFHQAYNSSDEEGAQNAAGESNAVLGAYLNSLGLGVKAISWMTEKGADDLNFLTASKAEELGIGAESSDYLRTQAPVQSGARTAPSASPSDPGYAYQPLQGSASQPQRPVARGAGDPRMVSYPWVVRDLHLRVAPDPNSRDVLGPPPYDYIRVNSWIILHNDQCVMWNTTKWCRVDYWSYKGWVNTSYLRGG
jgi:hypothetical protein